jgi:hypothetical protein
MQPAALGSGIEGFDVVGRLQYDPTKKISFGLAAEHKRSERFENGADFDVTAFGGDTQLEFGAFEITLEAEVFQNSAPPPVASPAATPGRTPWAFGAIGYATYTVELSRKWGLEPVIVLEWVDPDLDYSRDDHLRAVAGFSLNYKKNTLRVMPQVELKRPTSGAGPRGEIASETYYLMVSSDI